MKLITKNIRFFAIAIPLLASQACTKLDENVYDQIITDTYYNNRTEVLSAVLRPYTHTNAWITSSGQVGYWRVNELAGDQLAWPVKGVHGQDNGNWVRLHYHTWVPDDPEIVWNPWSLMFTGVGFCNTAIENLEKREAAAMQITQAEKDAYIADLKFQRAFYYLKIMDLYGNVPIVTKVGEVSPPTKPRSEVFKFIETEIKENIDKSPVLSPSLIGRMSKAGAYAMLAELYLNAEKWTGVARWDDCIAACDQLIQAKAGSQTASPMALDANINATFSNTNQNSREIILSIAYDFQKSTFRANFNSDFYHFNQRFIYDGSFNGNDGVIVIPGVHSKYKNNDQRKKDWFLIGPQFYKNDPTKPVVGGFEYKDQPLVFVDNVRKNKTGGTETNMNVGEENSGVRFDKYKPGTLADPAYFSNDWVVYRLTWIYFAKAEALMRKNGGVATAEAVQLINDCKKRAFSEADWETEKYTTATLTMDELLEERGREFIFEGVRRTDQIRFGKFVNTAWWDHIPSNDKNKELFPIPFRQIAANPNLTQNPGY